jgi:hypothetical protein
MAVFPSSGRFQWIPGVSGGVLVIPSRKRAIVIGFLAVWLGGWSFGVLAVPHFLARPDLFLAVWLLVWAVAECGTAAAFGYFLAGREIITLSPEALSIRLEIFGIGHTRAYQAAAIRALRPFRQRFLPGRRGSRELLSDLGCCIAFRYGAETIGFGRGLSEADAREVVTELMATGVLPTGGIDTSIPRLRPE